MIATSYPLNKILTAIARQHVMKEALTDEDLAGHELSPDERAALNRIEIATLTSLPAYDDGGELL